MNKFLFALPLLVGALACPAFANGISLQDALSASLQHNPQLAGYQFRRAALAGEHTTVALRPELRLHSEMENVAGSGDFSGIDGAELTLSFSSIIELGDQRDARLGVVTARQQQLATEQRVAVLDLVAAVNYRFITLVAAQEQVLVQEQAQQLTQSLVTSLSKRVQAGRAPQEELLRARAAQARAALEVGRARQQVQAEAVKLSAYWADSTPDFTLAQGDLFALTNSVSLVDWQARLAQNPDLLLLADETRLRSAELRKAEAEGQMTLGWSAGVRQMQATDDTALVAGINIPLASGKRASGAISKARAEQDAAMFVADSTKVQLEARLNQIYSAHQQALAELYSLRDQILPLLQDANRATAAAFDQGRYSSLELALAQRELLEARAALIDAALRAHETRIELERLTASAPVESTQLVETAQ
uniref:CzcC cation outer membrane efflux system protein n=1 Tax=uncultured organism TaxID=155900 RepID=D8VMU6_9ZZZZ|nr:CzcC cation outer membrane efflux system protein [uncultured organism]